MNATPDNTARPFGGGHLAQLPGLIDLDAATYHADQLGDGRPSLSVSLAKILINQSPAHARAAHPRLNPDYERVDDDRFDLGTSAHQLFLEGESSVEIVYADSWRTKDAKEQRELARSYGRVAMLEHDWDKCCQMVAALRAQCDGWPGGALFADGVAEKTIVWEDEFGVLCRARLDWLIFDPARHNRAAVHDLKTTKASASPDAWSRTALSIGADIQACLYLRGCEKVLGVRPDFLFVAVETTAPFAMSVFTLAPDTLALAEKKVSAALKLWATCLRNDSWPAYSTQVAHITTPPYLEAAWLERELREVA